jgi:hypothetical protein
MSLNHLILFSIFQYIFYNRFSLINPIISSSASYNSASSAQAFLSSHVFVFLIIIIRRFLFIFICFSTFHEVDWRINSTIAIPEVPSSKPYAFHANSLIT